MLVSRQSFGAACSIILRNFQGTFREAFVNGIQFYDSLVIAMEESQV